MVDIPLPRSAAWAPWLDGDRDWVIEREFLASSWLLERAEADRSPIVVQVPQDAARYGKLDGPLGDLARAGNVATYKSPVGYGATFVHHADIKLLATGMSTADGNAMAVTEVLTCPLDGWAMAVGAVNLATNEPTVDTRTSEQRELLDRFIDKLYNGWAHRQVGRLASAYYLPLLVDSGMTYAVFLGSMLAAAPSHLDNLSDIAEMKKALPPAWKDQAEDLSSVWSRKG